jgi:mannose/fructose-specific phosphotransferase system component IIA
MRVAGIVVTHGNLAEELLRTARTVYGDFVDCHALSNSSKSPRAVESELASLIESRGGDPCVIFVDFVGGSCSQACLKQLVERPDPGNIHLISGVNLPMLLAFLNKRGEVPFEELPRAILERSLDSIRVLDPREM